MKNIYSTLFAKLSFRRLGLFTLALFYSGFLSAQIDNNGCVGAGFGIDAGLYSNLIEFGDGSPIHGSTASIDWFLGSGGRGTIDETGTAALNALILGGGNPQYSARMASGLSSIVGGQILIDAVWARDHFGGTGYYDHTCFETASKNGEDPAIWDLGQMNVLGKNDLIDVAGHMLRDGTGLTSDLWFYGVINRAEPGGSAYMDFEFYVEDLARIDANDPSDPGESVFTSGGPDLGHTAFQFDASGNITRVGDFIFNVSLINGGVEASVEMRLWVSYTDYTSITPASGFTWGLEYDGAFNGSPYGYASIIPASNEICGIVNLEGENPATPPWGSLGTKTNSFINNYIDYSLLEVGLNMSAFGVDHASLAGLDPCEFPINTYIVKTRASASFTAQLKDYAGPYSWGQPKVRSSIVGDPLLACDNPTVTLTASPNRPDVEYSWTTVDGNIVGDPNLATIEVDQPGTYTLTTTLPTTCITDETSVTVGYDPAKPFFNEPTAVTTFACNANDGTIDLTVTGATSPYTFLWSNGSTAEDLTGLSPGDYTVTITDAIGCNIISGVFTVGARIPTVITGVQTNVQCNGEKTGALDITASGAPPYTYSWSGPNGFSSTDEDIAGLKAGSYTVTATDVNGCETQQTFDITQPDPIVLSVVATAETDPAANDGTINLTVVSGGTPNFTFAWTGPNGFTSSNQDLTGLAAGVYTVTVTDNNGCTTQISVSVYEPEICDDGIDNDGDGLTDCFDPDCTVSPPGVITPSETPVCVGDTGVTYTIVDTGADSYTWTVPAGAIITAGQGTVQITVSWVENIGGQICVIATKDGCDSQTASCLTIDLLDVPPAAGSIIIK